MINPFFECKCSPKYSFETHGKGWVIYLGRCDHKHGFNLGYIEEPDIKQLEILIDFANRSLLIDKLIKTIINGNSNLIKE